MDTLINTKNQLSDAVEQIINLTALKNAQLTNTSNAANIRSIHLDSIVALLKNIPKAIKMLEYHEPR